MSCSTLRMLNELIPECGRMKTFTLSNACNIVYIKIYMITKAYTLHVIPKLVKLLPFKPTRKRTLISLISQLLLHRTFTARALTALQ